MVNVSIVVVTEADPAEDATSSPVLIVGAFPFLETLIVTLYEAGLLAQPDVVAVIVLPGVVSPVKDTDPPVGIETVGVVVGTTQPSWLPCAAQLTPA